ncbi:MAG: serine/threonine protein kinase [Planctomycetaceae bacterium]|nr:serine/threonine protein kinase [Planctomycetaceae bacterium]
MNDTSANASINPDPQSIEGLFLAALGHSSPDEREAFLTEACGDDAERRRRIEALLRAYDDAGSFLEHSPVSSQLGDSFNLEFLTPSNDPGLIGTLGPYEVFEVLGRGGMGIVFRARDPKLNRIVAIKVLAPELAANPNARRRFLREAQAAAAISHPHVVTIHAVDEGEDTSTPAAQSSRGASTALPYLVMECIVGQTLQQKLDKQGSLRLTETLRIGHQLACGLAAAHKQGVIHRDIKPANILLENGVERVKITDFGLARAADDVSITRTGEVSGTPQYMSPEQATGDPIDHRSDLFSLGCVLYAMCTGRSPFRATTLAAAIRRVCDDTPRAIAELNPETPTWLIAIIDQLLEKNPNARIQSADEVAELLNDHLAGVQQPATTRVAERCLRATHPRPAHVQPIKSVGSDSREHRSLWTADGLILIALILFTGTIVAFVYVAVGFPDIAPFKGNDFGTVVVPILSVAGVLLCVGLVSKYFKYVWSQLSPKINESSEWLGVTPRIDSISKVLIFSGIGVLGLTMLYTLAAESGFVPQPSYERRDSLLNWLTLPLLLGGIMIASGILLGRYIFRPVGDLYRVMTHKSSQLHADQSEPVKPPRSLHQWARLLMWAGVAIIVFPWLLILMRPAFPFPWRVETAQFLVVLGGILGLLTIIAGWITKLVAHSAEGPDTQTVSPWRVLGWLLVGGIGLVVCLFASSFVYLSLARQDRPASIPVRDIALPAENHSFKPSAPEPDFDGFPKVRTIPLAEDSPGARERDEVLPDGNPFNPPASAFSDRSVQSPTPRSGERTGYLNIDIQDDGLLVALRRKSAFGGDVPGSEQQVTDFGLTQLRLHPGEYAIRIRDKLFGFQRPQDQSLTIGQTVSNLVIQSNLAERPDRHEAASIGMNFAWDGKEYGMSSPALGLTVWLLLQAHLDGDPEIDEQELLRGLADYRFDRPDGTQWKLFDETPPTTLEKVIDKAPLQRTYSGIGSSDWKELIVPGKQEGTYRLAPLERGTLRVTSVSDGMRVIVTPVEKDPRFSSRAITSETKLQVPPGEYVCTVQDQWVGWGGWLSRRGGGVQNKSNVRTEVVSVHTEEATSVTVDRRLADYLSPPVPQSDDYQIGFTWFPEPRPDSFDSFGRPTIGYFNTIDNGFSIVRRDQLSVVLVLLRALANGHPEMGTSDLLKAAGIVEQPTIEALTTEIRNGPLNTIIIPGEAESTWRLKPPPEGAFGERVSEGEAENAIEESEPPPPPMPEDELPAGEKVPPELKIHLH